MIDFLSTPGTEDLAYKWILALFPKGETAYASAFSVFTSALTFLGALFMGWHIVIGIVTSAYSGKVLGERYHQIWAPLRVVLGFGMLVPIAGGLSSVHYLLRDVVGVAAVQMGNAPIKTYIAASTKEPIKVGVASLQGQELAYRILEFQACAAVVEGVNRTLYVDVNAAQANPEPAGVNTTYRSGIAGYWDLVTKPVDEYIGESQRFFTEWDFGDCGTLMFSQPVATGEFLRDAEGYLQEFQKVRTEATNVMIREMASSGLIDWNEFGNYFAKKSYDPEASPQLVAEMIKAAIIKDGIASALDRIGREWDEKVAAAAAKVFETAAEANGDRLLERIDKYGFMVAGSYERTLSQISSLTVSLANQAAEGTASNPGWWRYTDAFNAAMATLRQARNLEGEWSVGSAKTTGDEATKESQKILALISPAMVNMKLGIESADPVGDMVTFGHNMLMYAQSAILGLMAVSGVADAASGSAVGLVGGGLIGGAISYLLQWANYIVLIMIIVGVMHSYVFPMLPMIMVFVMGVSWLILFLEAAVAGLLWAFAFIRMDGQEFFDRNQAPGVTLLFNLFLRPAIGMLAFIGGLLLLPSLLNALTVVWNDTFNVQTAGSSWIAVWQWAMGLLIYTWMQWHISLRVYGLIPTIADRVGYWMGFQMHGYNDGQETNAAAGAMVAAGAAVSKAPIVPKGRVGGAGGGGTPPSPSGGGRGGGPSPSRSQVRGIAGNRPDPGRSRFTTPRR